MSTKGCSGFILFWLDLVVLIKQNKPGSNECVESKSLIFATNLISKQIKKIPEHLLVEIDKWEKWAKFQQKIFNSMVVGTHQNSQFFRQNM